MSPESTGIRIGAFNDAKVIGNIQERQFSKLLIPIYQRPYCWGPEQVNDLLKDLYNAWRKSTGKSTEYYLGTISLVTRPDDNNFDVLDGQQRLITLTIICACLKKRLEKINIFDAFLYYQGQPRLDFVTRDNIKKGFRQLVETGEILKTDQPDQQADAIQLTDYLTKAHETIKAFINYYFISEKSESSESIKFFADWLAKHVIMFAVEVPQKSDKSEAPQSLYKYYDLVNSTGKQLQKSDILKEKLLSNFSKKPQLQDELAGIWNDALQLQKFVDEPYCPALENSKTESNGESKKRLKTTLADIVNHLKPNGNGDDNNKNNRTTPPILKGWKLVVLAYDLWKNEIRLGQKRGPQIETEDTDTRSADTETWNRVTVDDVKNLIGDEQKNIVDFIYLLYTLRLCLDQFIIIPTDDSNEQIPNMRYEYDGRMLIKRDDEDVERPREKCRLLQESLLGSTLENHSWVLEATGFMLQRFNLNKTPPVFDFSWHDLYTHMEATERERIKNRFFNGQYSSGQKSEKIQQMMAFRYNKTSSLRYLLNFIDYLLAKESLKNKEYMRFTQRTSIEHIFPQKPVNSEGEAVSYVEEVDEIWNLALLTAHRNSKYCNETFASKKIIFDNYFKEDKNRIESFRLYEIFKKTDQTSLEKTKESMKEKTKIQLGKVIDFIAEDNFQN